MFSERYSKFALVIFEVAGISIVVYLFIFGSLIFVFIFEFLKEQYNQTFNLRDEGAEKEDIISSIFR